MTPFRSIPAALIALALAAALLGAEPTGARAAELPTGIADPDVAIHDPTYSDPVFWWRISSLPKNPMEPERYFYWPDAVVPGAPQPFLPAARAAHTSVDGAALEAVATWAAEHKSDALIVVHKGVVQLERYWNGARADELENGRSISKSITPMLLGFAVAEGKIALEDPIAKFIGEWRDDPRGRITVRQLAENVSGLEVAAALPVTVIHGNKDLCLVYCGDVVRAALAYDYAIPPGTRFEVTQENTQLLALVVERAMGTPIQTLLSERVWKPIGGADATFQLDRPGGHARTMCCMRATPHDWTRLGVLVAQDGRWAGHQVLPPGWIRTMATPSARNPNFGLGLWLGSPYLARRSYFEGRTDNAISQSEPFLADDVRFMEGGGNRTVFIVPSAQLVIFRHGKSSESWDQAYLVNRLLEALARKRS